MAAASASAVGSPIELLENASEGVKSDLAFDFVEHNCKGLTPRRGSSDKFSLSDIPC